LDTVFLCVLAFVLFYVSAADIKTQEIPDRMLLIALTAGLLWIGLSHFIGVFNAPIWYDALLGSVAGAVPLLIMDILCLLFIGQDGFGYGDIKLMLVAGLFLGWKSALISLLFSILAGGAVFAFLLGFKIVKRKSYIAFAPFLSLGIILSLWFGKGFLILLLGGAV